MIDIIQTIDSLYIIFRLKLINHILEALNIKRI
jgi:hypothetical protein